MQTSLRKVEDKSYSLYQCIQQYHAEGGDKHTIFNQNLSSSAPQKAEKKSSAPLKAEEISSASEEVEEERATQNKNKQMKSTSSKFCFIILDKLFLIIAGQMPIDT